MTVKQMDYERKKGKKEEKGDRGWLEKRREATMKQMKYFHKQGSISHPSVKHVHMTVHLTRPGHWTIFQRAPILC